MNNFITTGSTKASQLEVANRKQFSRMRDNIRHKFALHSKNYQFIRHRPGHIIPEYDSSVLFTGSTISTFKPYLESETIPESGFYMIQSCLRTQNTKLLNDASKRLEWASYFSSIGALAKYCDLNKLIRFTWTFFQDELGINPNRLRIRISSKDIDLLDACIQQGLEAYLEVDNNSPNYYTHTFGMNDVVGRNFNFAIISKDSQKIRDIGNVIVIENQHRKIGVEIAFGVETILSRILDLPSPISASLITDIVPIKNSFSLKMADAISAAIIIADSGERPVVTNRGRILRKYIQAISNIRHDAKISIEEIEQYSTDFEIKEFGSKSEVSIKIVEYIRQYESLIKQQLNSNQINKLMSKVFPETMKNRKSRVPISARY